jgi:hypothetical protein
MGEQHFIISYMRACASHALPGAECGPVWQLSIIAALVALAVMALIVLRLRGGSSTAARG